MCHRQYFVVHTQHIVQNCGVFNRIGLFRHDRGLSRRDLANAVDVNPQTIGYLERGDYKPSLELALKVAKVFDMPVEMIFSLEPFPSNTDALRGAGEQQ